MTRSTKAKTCPCSNWFLFDVDGTLIDSAGQIIAATNAAFEALGLARPEPEAIRQGVGLSVEEAMRRLAPDADTDSLARAYRAAFFSIAEQQTAAECAPLYPGADGLVASLSQSDWVMLGVATGKSRRGLDRVLTALGWERMFQTLQVADLHPSKPHPSMVHTALAETGVEAKDAVVIGDSVYDMLMAQAAGVQSIGVSWGYSPVQDLKDAGAGTIVSEMGQILPVLRDQWGDL